MSKKKFLTDVEIRASLKLDKETKERALVIDSNGEVKASIIEIEELEALSGFDLEDDQNQPITVKEAIEEVEQSLEDHKDEVTAAHEASAIEYDDTNTQLGEVNVQTAIEAVDAKIEAVDLDLETNYVKISTKGQPLGVAELDGAGKVPISQLPNAIMEYQGQFDPTTDELKDGEQSTEAAGDVYQVTQEAEYNFTEGREAQGGDDPGDNIIFLHEGDMVIYSGSKFDRSVNGNDVISVNAKKGMVVLDATDLEYKQDETDDWTLADESSIAQTLDEVGSRLTSLETLPDGKVFVNGDDTTAGYLEDKLIGTDNKIVVSTQNDEEVVVTIGSDVFDKSSNTTDDVTEGSNNLFHTDKRAVDAVEDVLTAGDAIAIDVAHEDEDPLKTIETITVKVKSKNSIVVDNDEIQLKGDEDTPDADKYYGTDSLGNVGYHLFPVVTPENDIQETSFSGNEGEEDESVTGFYFDTNEVRSFNAIVSVHVNADEELFEAFNFTGINVGGTFQMAQESVGSDSGISFEIDGSGQVTYSSETYQDFDSLTIKFKAITTSI